MTFEEKIAIASKMMRENDKRNEERINKEIDECKMAYKIQDSEGNVFVFAGLENGFPSPLDPSWNGNYYSLKKCNKEGKESKV